MKVFYELINEEKLKYGNTKKRRCEDCGKFQKWNGYGKSLTCGYCAYSRWKKQRRKENKEDTRIRQLLGVTKSCKIKNIESLIEIKSIQLKALKFINQDT